MEKLIESMKPVVGLANAALSSVTPDYVSLAKYNHLTITIINTNAAGTSTSAITLKQATAVAGTSEKALGFSYRWSIADVSAGDTFTKTAVTSNTFNAGGVASKNSIHVIEVDADQLDVENGFDCVRVGAGDSANGTMTILYTLSNPRFNDMTNYGGPAAITD